MLALLIDTLLNLRNALYCWVKRLTNAADQDFYCGACAACRAYRMGVILLTTLTLGAFLGYITSVVLIVGVLAVMRTLKVGPFSQVTDEQYTGE